jgi:hydrogenase expression/formation protein HypC
MCLAVPGKMVARFEENGLPMGKVDFDGAVMSVCLAYVPDAQEGEYVIVHAGFALSVLDETEALKTLDLLRELDEHERHFREEPGADDDKRPNP